MAGQVKNCFAFLLVFHVSLVSCRPDYHQYFSQYIKDATSTESSLSSTTGTSTGKSENISIPEDIYSENVISPKANSYYSSNNEAYEKPVQSAYSNDYDKNGMHKIAASWGLRIACLVALALIIYCFKLCCPCCCKGKESRGYIINTNAPEQPTANLVQPLIPQAIAMQHFPPEASTPLHPPAYDTQPIQQQFQYPTSEHFLQQYPMQPMDQQQNPMQPMGQQQNPVQSLIQQQYQEPLIPYGYSNPEAASPPYPTKN